MTDNSLPVAAPSAPKVDGALNTLTETENSVPTSVDDSYHNLAGSSAATNSDTPGGSATGRQQNQPHFGPATLESFQVSLEVFEGPFDLLLQLISRRQLDITQVALAEVTDEFIKYMSADPQLASATDFLVVAATLLDMKAAALLPREQVGEQEPDDFSARDLLFQRLLQYRAFKEAAAAIRRRLDQFAGSLAREVPLEPHFAAILPELTWTLTAESLATLAATALAPKPRPDEARHITTFEASVSAELSVLIQKLQHNHRQTFHDLVADAPNQAVLVARFLGLLELFRRGLVSFKQDNPLDTLYIDYKKLDDSQESTATKTFTLD